MKNTIKGKTDLGTINPMLAKEWHPTLNGDLTPGDVTKGSNKVVWWQCRKHKEHEWEASVNHRNRGSGCPVCAGRTVLLGYNDLATMNPELATEWHPKFNGDSKPEGYTPNSNKIVWWQCSKNEEHFWNASINNRSNGRGCPVCAGKKALFGHTDLATINPGLAKEWHPTKNGNLMPEEFAPNSNKIVWWQCRKEKEHCWSASISNRNKGSDCPVCTGRTVLVGYNDLATINPELAKEWHPTKNGDLTPFNITVGSSNKVFWQCSKHKEHAWPATTNDRRKGNGCPYCSNRKVLSGYNDLATINPEVAEEWHPTKNGDLTPENITFGSKRMVWWQCKRGHEWQSKLAVRNVGHGCKKCFSETQTSFPEQAIYFYLKQAVPVEVESRASIFGVEVDIYIPSWGIGIEYDGMRFHGSDESTIKENKKNEILLKNNIRLIRIKECTAATSNTTDFIYCVPDGRYSYLKLLLNALSETLSKSQGVSIFFDVDIERDSIRIMEQYVEMVKTNSLAVKNPVLAAEWHATKNGQIQPEQISFSSGKRVWWQCRKHKKHTWIATVSARNTGSGCPHCSNKKVMVGYNDLATINPELAKEWHPTKNGDLTPFNVTAGSGNKVFWQCSKHKEHVWTATVNSRNRGCGCSYCAGRKVLAGNNDLATTHPEVSAEWHPVLNGDLMPTNVVAGSNKKVWWQCARNHGWQAVISSRKMGFKNCPECAKLAKQNTKK